MNYGIVVIGGSAGALTALQRIVADLPADIPAAVFVATHIAPDSVSAMPHILTRNGPLFATHAIDRAPISPGRIFVAPPDHHLILNDGIMRVEHSAKENGQRPSIDLLFRSAAEAYGPAVCGALLSGTLDDGVAGLQAIRAAGGTAFVQDPDDALFSDMPRHALAANAAHAAIRSDLLGAAIDAAIRRALAVADNWPPQQTSPDYYGPLWEMENHTANSMVSAQYATLEEALWAAVRIVQERGDLLRRLAQRAQERGDKHAQQRLEAQAQEVHKNELAIRKTLANLAARRQTSVS